MTRENNIVTAERKTRVGILIFLTRSRARKLYCTYIGPLDSLLANYRTRLPRFRMIFTRESIALLDLQVQALTILTGKLRPSLIIIFGRVLNRGA